MSSNEKEKPSPSPNTHSWFKPKEPDSASITSTGDPKSIDVKVVKVAEDDPKPVSFSTLFRFVSLPVSIYVFDTPSPPTDSPLEQRSYSITLLLLLQ